MRHRDALPTSPIVPRSFSLEPRSRRSFPVIGLGGFATPSTVLLCGMATMPTPLLLLLAVRRLRDRSSRSGDFLRTSEAANERIRRLFGSLMPLDASTNNRLRMQAFSSSSCFPCAASRASQTDAKTHSSSTRASLENVVLGGPIDTASPSLCYAGGSAGLWSLSHRGLRLSCAGDEQRVRLRSNPIFACRWRGFVSDDNPSSLSRIPH